MLHQENCNIFVAQCAQQIGKRYFLRPAQSGGGFIENDQRGVGGERPGNFKNALLAQRQVAGKVMGIGAEPDPFELKPCLETGAALFGAIEPCDASEDPGAGAQIGSEQHIVEKRHAGPDPHMLEGTRDPGSGNTQRPDTGDIFSEKHDRAGVARERTGDQVENGALAGAVWTDKADDFAGSDFEPHLTDGFEAAKAFGEALDDKQRGAALRH